VLQKLGDGGGPAGGVLHAPDCEEAPQGAPLLDRDHVLDLAENPATRLCTLCGCAQELTPPCVALTMAPTLTPAAAGLVATGGGVR
jgi:hypothetical protein